MYFAKETSSVIVPSFNGPGDCSMPHSFRLSILDCHRFLEFIEIFGWKWINIFKAQNFMAERGLEAP